MNKFRTGIAVMAAACLMSGVTVFAAEAAVEPKDPYVNGDGICAYCGASFAFVDAIILGYEPAQDEDMKILEIKKGQVMCFNEHIHRSSAAQVLYELAKEIHKNWSTVLAIEKSINGYTESESVL